MYYESALRFLLGALKKCGIPTRTVRLSDHPKVGQLAQYDISVEQALGNTAPATVCSISDRFGCNYIYLRLPETAQSLLIIGPYLEERLSAPEILALAERLHLTPNKAAELQTYMNSIAILPDNSPIYQMLEQFYETLWGTGGYKTEYTGALLDAERIRVQDIPSKDTPLNSQLLEQRYTMENTLMEAVARGDLQKAERGFSRFSPELLEQRTPDTLRNTKNYSIILNTLLRKAAEQGGVHPSYIDRISSDFAIRIEKLPALPNAGTLMKDMIRGYCLLVKDHNTGHCSPLVQRAILTVDSDLSADLSLRSLAQALNVSGSYLSTLFKKETGQTVTAFINSRRIRHARQLLRSTGLQIQTIAQHCGFPDVNYFSKTFKKLTGFTPKAYRADGK